MSVVVLQSQVRVPPDEADGVNTSFLPSIPLAPVLCAFTVMTPLVPTVRDETYFVASVMQPAVEASPGSEPADA